MNFSGIFRISRIANLQHWLFFNFVDVFLMFLEKSEGIFPFSGIKEAQWWHVYLREKQSISFVPVL